MKEYDLNKILFSLSGNQINEGTMKYNYQKNELFSSDNLKSPDQQHIIHHFKTTAKINQNPESPYMKLIKLLQLQKKAKIITPLIFND